MASPLSDYNLLQADYDPTVISIDWSLLQSKQILKVKGLRQGYSGVEVWVAGETEVYDYFEVQVSP